QLCMAAYYMLGGAFAVQMCDHVRMDLFCGQWSWKRRAAVGCITGLCVLVYLRFMVCGGFTGTAYALQYGEKSYSSWAPYMAPIKIIMTFGAVMMLLQAVSSLIKDIAEARGKPIV